MKKLGLIFAAAVAAVSLGSLTASAYPPGGPVLVLTPSTATPGASIAASFTGCSSGETVSFTLNGVTITAQCNGPAGATRRPTATAGPVATATLTAPTVVGTYPVVATGGTSGVSATATLTVVAATPGGGGDLPATGSDSAPTAQIAAGLVAVGAGLAIVGGLRRRKRAVA